MTTNIEITAAASAATAIDSGRTAIASCLLGDLSSSLRSTLRGTGVLTGTGVFGGGSERPTWAPVAQAARIFGYAPVAGGAEHPALLAKGGKAVANQQFSKMRAFRGLEPWRDPA